MRSDSPLTTDLWLVRHGETDWNKESRFQGSRDIPLNAAGMHQAEAIAQKLCDGAYDAIYSSDLTRALQTAQQISAQTGLEIIKDASLREINMGIWEGRTIDEIAGEYPAQWQQWQKNPAGVNPPPGESVREVVRRVTAFADELTALHPGGRIIIVAHGISIAALTCKADGLSLAEIYRLVPQNTEVRHLTWKIRSESI
jgi:alpha-ribazole phosphatase